MEQFRLDSIALTNEVYRQAVMALLQKAKEEGQPFHEYTGERDKVWHDVIRTDWRIFTSLYPNGTGWHGNCPRIDDSEVAYIRVSPEQPWDKIQREREEAASKGDA